MLSSDSVFNSPNEFKMEYVLMDASELDQDILP